MPVVISFFLSDRGGARFMLFAITIEAMKMNIINPIEVHRLSSPSIESKMKVAAIPLITASPMRSQNSLSRLRLF